MPSDPMRDTVNFRTGESVYLYLGYDKTDSLQVKTLFSHTIAQSCDPVPKGLEHLTGEPSPWKHRILDTTGKKQEVFSVDEKILIQKDYVNTRPPQLTIT
ncbi:hypothetical protein [Nitrosopumilus sp.]|uniref:hypothetical protein n=1 Tax=Nitrosopumilus sp. TaxID=2024843 RepID=UPI0029307AA5|nr:hypothetical protein [Nitrosopumilus sp.]